MPDYAAQASRHLAEAEADIRTPHEGSVRDRLHSSALTWEQHLELADRYIQLAEIETRLPGAAPGEEP
jgi:hypothetical protein